MAKSKSKKREWETELDVILDTAIARLKDNGFSTLEAISYLHGYFEGRLQAFKACRDA